MNCKIRKWQLSDAKDLAIALSSLFRKSKASIDIYDRGQKQNSNY